MLLRRLHLQYLGPSACVLVLASCERAAPPAPAPADSARVTTRVGSPELPKELAPKPAPPVPSVDAPATAAAEAPPAPTAWSVIPSLPADRKGPWFHVTASSAGVYAEENFDSKKIGYLRSGAKVLYTGSPKTKKNCTSGWYALESGGYLCGNHGTTDTNHPEVKFAPAQPNLADVLPYPYARNAKNGTPLYKTVPSREQMERYEPYLLKPKDGEKPSDKRPAAGETPAVAVVSAASPGLGATATDPGLLTATAVTEPEPEKPWWQREDSKDRLHELKLNQLESDADDLLAKRMVSGFYVAVDKSFRWNNRPWYKTTRGLVAPSDRFWQTAGPKYKGVELDGDTWKLPLGWVYGGRKNIGSYRFDNGAKQPKNDKSYDRFAPLPLTGKSEEFNGTRYDELADGSWVKHSQIRVTKPGPMPANLGENERWIDVNLTTQTLVAFVGTRPVFATLISSGKQNKKDKDKDHSTPTGEWRVREKHVTTTMDGDGTAAGDLPYSIEDVPYVMYFHRAYALHGAFWHNNYGTQMSHGCVNLSPLDAKYLFFFAEPMIPAGFHGAWSNDAHPGSRIVIHE